MAESGLGWASTGAKDDLWLARAKVADDGPEYTEYITSIVHVTAWFLRSRILGLVCTSATQRMALVQSD